MADQGHKLTELSLKMLQNKVNNAYKQASEEVTAKAERYFAQFKTQDEAKIKDLRSGKITRKQYDDWRMSKMITGQKWLAMRDSLARDLVNTDRFVMGIINDNSIDVYALNMNFSTFAIERMSQISTNFALYDRGTVQYLLSKKRTLLPKPSVDIPKDMKWNKSKIQSAVTQGILQGDSIQNIARRLQDVTNMDKNVAIRNARTATTGAENAGRIDSYKRAQALGIAVKKMWVSTLDNVTRDSHVDLDGEVQDIDKNFSNGLDHPGGMGPPEEVYNCRCCLVPQYDKYKTDITDLNMRENKLGNMSYDDWKKAHGEKKKKAEPSPKQKPKPKKMQPKAAPQQKTVAQAPAKAPTPMPQEKFDKQEWMDALRKQDDQGKFRGWFDSWMKKLTRDERDGVNTYTGGDYRKINNYLRGFSSDASPWLKGVIKDIESALEKASLPEDVILRRGVDYHAIEGMFKIGSADKLVKAIEDGTFDQKFLSSIVSDKGFISTSAKSSGGFHESFELVIKAKKGARGMYVAPISQFRSEEETLLHNDCLFKVEGAEKDWGATRIFLTLLN